ncbi:MAG TPA: ATP-binding protein [Gammaproteobacteria bacterium]|nr:ATP-binding protein [Gammaproteobacteria bacterium]
MGKRPYVSIAAAAVLLAGSQPALAGRVVLLYGLDLRVPGYAALVDTIEEQIADAHDLEPVEIYPEFLDDLHFPEKADQQVFADYLRSKYADGTVDAVVAVSSGTVAFLVSHRDSLFAGVPMVFSALETSPYTSQLPARASAVVVPFEPVKTLELARWLQPGLENVFVIADDTEPSAHRSAALHRELNALGEGLRLEFLEGLPLDALLERVRNLPPSSAILYDAIFRDGDAKNFDATDVAQLLADNANVPVYGLHAGYVGRGIVGGYLSPFESIGTQLGRLTVAALRGDGSAPAATTLTASYVVDARAMARWGLEAARLPPGSELRFSSPSAWKLYRGWIIALLVLVALQFALILALTIQSMSRRKDRAALTEAAHRFRLARIAGQVGFWQWDPATDGIAVEAELGKFLGYDTSAGSSIDWRAHVYRDDLPRVLKAARRHLRGRSAYFEAEHRVLDRSNAVRWFLSRGQVLRDRDNRPIRMVGTAIDITDRKRSEDERARAQLQLHEQRIELAHLSRAAAAGALSGALAHEIKQPLSAILSNAQAGQRYLTQPHYDREELAAILHDIENDGRRAGQVIYHLRNLLHRGEEHYEVVPLDAVVRDVLQLMHSDFVARNIRVTLTSMSSLPPILADRVQLQQVMLNLLNNAADSMSNVEPRERRIAIGATIEGERVHVTVADTGYGFANSDPDIIFKPFVTTKRHGLGLGLSISRSIVETHGGRIWAENNSNGGATLHVTLPITTPQPS